METRPPPEMESRRRPELALRTAQRGGVIAGATVSGGAAVRPARSATGARVAGATEGAIEGRASRAPADDRGGPRYQPAAVRHGTRRRVPPTAGWRGRQGTRPVRPAITRTTTAMTVAIASGRAASTAVRTVTVSRRPIHGGQGRRRCVTARCQRREGRGASLRTREAAPSGDGLSDGAAKPAGTLGRRRVARRRPHEQGAGVVAGRCRQARGARATQTRRITRGRGRSLVPEDERQTEHRAERDVRKANDQRRIARAATPGRSA